jgi:hypothetical protein
MKTLTIILFVALCACNPYHKLESPATMRYSVNVPDQGHILCRYYLVSADTLILFDAGYYALKLKQNRTSEIRFVGLKEYMIIDLKK